MKIWLRAIGFFRGFWIVSLIPCSTGAVIGYLHSAKFEWLRFIAVMIGVWLLHAATNLFNDYYDFLSGADNRNPIRTPFSGGTLVIQEGLLQPRAIRNAAFILMFLGLILFGIIGLVFDPIFIPLALIGATAGYFYTAPPLKFAYRGIGEIVLGAVFGPAVSLAGYWSQTSMKPLSAIFVGGVLGVISAAIILANEVPDQKADAAARKKTLVVRLGIHGALDIHRALIIAAGAGIVVLVVSSIVPSIAMLSLVTYLPVAALTVRASLSFDESVKNMVGLCKLSILSQVFMWGGLMAGLLLSR